MRNDGGFLLWWDGLRSEMQPIHDSQGVFAVLELTDLEHPMLMSNPVCLSHREREILQWTADGKSSGEIAIILSISESTVNFHHKNIQKKFDAPNKTLAAAYA
ncbi:LuxR C-terminal-related transcriptional regulator, partial [Pseudomonas aeruginosa]